MFTGLVETTGRIESRSREGPGHRLTIAAELGDLELGESISVSGACLTVTSSIARSFTADVSPETAAKTTLGGLAVGATVNLERSVRLGDRLGGHLVTGHVDAVATVVRTEPAGDALRVVVALPPELLPLVAVKGSITLDGVSLTVNGVEGDRVEIMLVPHTLAVTNLGRLAASSSAGEIALNVEVDLLARYVARWLEATGDSRRETSARDAKILAALERGGRL